LFHHDVRRRLVAAVTTRPVDRPPPGPVDSPPPGPVERPPPGPVDRLRGHPLERMIEIVRRVVGRSMAGVVVKALRAPLRPSPGRQRFANVDQQQPSIPKFAQLSDPAADHDQGL
jgi:hypothetical protein